MSHIDIREMESIDLDLGLLDVLETLAPVHLSLRKASDVTLARYLGNILTFVAVEIPDSQFEPPLVVGTASLVLERKLIHGGALAGRVEEVVVRPEYQGRNIGKALMARVVEEARSRGVYKLTLSCKPEKVAFYEACGFHRHEVAMRLDLHGEA